VADDLQVRLAGSPRDDADIARAIAHVLEWNVQIPTGRVQARVQDARQVRVEGADHTARLYGHVHSLGEADAARAAAAAAPGVARVESYLTVFP
jgi:osmotically-inducible protein OsmY